MDESVRRAGFIFRVDLCFHVPFQCVVQLVVPRACVLSVCSLVYVAWMQAVREWAD